MNKVHRVGNKFHSFKGFWLIKKHIQFLSTLIKALRGCYPMNSFMHEFINDKISWANLLLECTYTNSSVCMGDPKIQKYLGEQGLLLSDLSLLVEYVDHLRQAQQDALWSKTETKFFKCINGATTHISST